jgi:hypothetical protein
MLELLLESKKNTLSKPKQYRPFWETESAWNAISRAYFSEKRLAFFAI